VLAADHRLRDSDAFRRTVSSGRRAGGAALVVHLLDDVPGAGDAGPRVGLVVGKAVGNAVVRNRVKRQLRHLVKDHLTHLPASSDLVVRALPPAAGMRGPELGAELARCLQRVGRADLPRDPASATRTGAAS
jgi:ribonuclease P protein component